jgi:transposase
MERIEKRNWGRIAAMEMATHSLPCDPLQLHAEVIRLRHDLVAMEQKHAQVLADRDQQIKHLLEKILLLTRQRFGPSSDRISPDQLGLFNEAELEADIAALELQVAPLVEPPAPTPEAAPPAPKAKPVRKPLPEHLPRVDRIIDLTAEDKQALGANYGLIGYDSSEQLAIIPRQPYVIRTLRAKYAPRHPELAGGEEGVIIAPRAAQILPKSMAHSSLLAALIIIPPKTERFAW